MPSKHKAFFRPIMAMLSAIFIAVLLEGKVSAAQAQPLNSFYCIITGTVTSYNACAAATIPLAGLGILLSFAVVGIAYMIGNVMNIEGLKNWYKQELYETLKSALIISIIFSVILILSGFAADFVSSSNSSGIAAVYSAVENNYLYPELENANAAFAGMFGLYNGIIYLSSLTFGLYLPIPIPPFPVPFASLGFGYEDSAIYTSTVLGAGSKSSGFLTDYANMILVPVMLILQVQYDILLNIIMVGLGVLIPIGVILRAIPFLRPLGGSLLALGIGIAIVYPSLLLILNLPASQFIAPIPTVPMSNYVTTCPSSSFFSSIVSVIYAFTTLGNQFMSSAFTAIGTASTAANPGLIGGAVAGSNAGTNSLICIYPAFNFITSPVYFNLIVQYILFILDLVIAIVISQNIAKVLGGSLRLGIGRLKLT